MPLHTYLRAIWKQRRARREKAGLFAAGDPGEIIRADWGQSLVDPTSFYLRCHRYFHHRLPAELKIHREYFSKEGRGFGEDAFHVLWYLLFNEFKPRDFLEIGVWRGQSLSLASLLQRRVGSVGKIVGISPFRPAGDSAPHYRHEVDYYEDTLANFAHFSLPKPTLLRAFSTDQEAAEVISSQRWDCIYIDGDHEYPVAKSDWDMAVAAIKPGGIIVMDDSGLGTAFAPPAFASKGIEGPSAVVAEIDRNRFREILQVGHNRVFESVAS